MTSPSLASRLRDYVGRPAGPAEVGPDPVNAVMIRHWCEAIGDANPAYTDPDAAQASVHGGLVAPPTMLQTWGMKGLARRGREPGNAYDELLTLLDAAGFTSVVATNCEQAYQRYLRVGDQLTVRATIESVSEEKVTKLGPGYFVTTRQDYWDSTGAPVASMLFRILKFAPQAAPARPPRPRPVITKDTAFFFEGTLLGELRVQRCASCHRLRHPPGPMCPHCQSLDWDVQVADGRGQVYSFVVNHHPQVPAFDYPLVVGLVELTEGVRIVADLVGIAPADVAIGLPVVVEFLAVDDELSLPQFRPATENPVG
ncbi:MAG: bifunctional MaoC family dehydratase N-terminal/OB-fold nucleic acid binding domain-containing protein [Mycobacteriales bacterium]